MNTKAIIALTIIGVLAIGGALVYGLGGTNLLRPSPGVLVLCAADVRECPDGSYVNRTSPTCEFKACPTATTTPQNGGGPNFPTTTTTLTLGANTLIGQTVTLALLEDSRCPVDVECVWAGTVRVKATFKDATYTFTLDKPQTIGFYAITLTGVTPEKNSKVTIKPEDYRFTFVAGPANPQMK